MRSDEPASPGEMVCPECGGDVRITRDVSVAWTHRVRLIPMIVWLLMLCGLLAVASPWGQERVGNRYGMWDDVVSSNGTPDALPEHVVSMGTVGLAAMGDAAAAAELGAYFDEVEEEAEKLGAPARVRFGAKTLLGTIIDDTRYGFGGVAYSSMSMTTVSDVREPDLYERAPYRMLKNSVKWFPYTVTQINHNGAQYVKRTYDPVGILVQVCMCLAAIWVLCVIGRRLGLRVLESRQRRVSVFVLFLLGTTLWAWWSPTLENPRRSLDAAPESVTAWIEAERFGEVAAGWADPVVFAQMLVDSLGDGQGEDDLYLVMQQNAGCATKNEYWMGMLSFSFPIAKLQRSSYFEGAPNSGGVRIDPPAYLRDLPFFEHSGLYWWQFRLGGDRSLHMLSFSPGSVCTLVVAFCLLWKLVLGSGRWVLGRVQRRRVARVRCVFCGYPLSPEALGARSAGDGAAPIRPAGGQSAVAGRGCPQLKLSGRARGDGGV